MKHLMLDGFQGYRSRFDDIRLMHELLAELPLKMGAEPIMPPFVLPYYDGVDPEDAGISGMVLLRGGHFTVHTFSYAECYFADFVYGGPSDPGEFRSLLGRALPCSSVETFCVDRSRPERAECRAVPSDDFGPHYTLDLKGYSGPRSLDGIFELLDKMLDRKGYENIRIDWHGHNDRGLALANALSAASAGAHRIHGTSIGIGERVGNVALDQLLVNLSLLGWSDRNLNALAEFCAVSSEALGIEIPINYPAVGRDAFRTATGVHASAILKAMDKGDIDLADNIYSGVRAGEIGRVQVVDIGPMSGKSNAIFWLRNQGIEPTKERIDALLITAKSSDRTLSTEECQDVLDKLS